MRNIHEQIKKDTQITKFCLYGFFKNLQFFEPYLIIYLVAMNLSFAQIGLLFGLRELIIYVFEVPSGIIADTYGKKTELLICFTFYIVSFIFFFIGQNIILLTVAMIFYAFGEAFRSGTHKAMIYAYLEQQNWFKYKTFVYGRTRSFSLLGTAISSILSVLIILITGKIRIVFLFCIIPFVLDFLLILSYPESLNEKRESHFSLSFFAKETMSQIKMFFSSPKIWVTTSSSATFDAVFKTVKDYIQPILQGMILVSVGTSDPDNFKVVLYLGIAYAIFNLLSALASRNVFRLTALFDMNDLLDKLMLLLGLAYIIIGAIIPLEIPWLVIVIFIISYVVKDARRPIFVDVIGDHIESHQRATVLSIESQLKSLTVMILAPTIGFLADHYNFSVVFITLGIIMLITSQILSVKRVFKED